MGPAFLIAVDPGLRECGVAVLRLEDGALLRAWLSRSPEKAARHNPAWSAMGLQVLEDLVQRFPEALSTPAWGWFLGETPELHKLNRSDREQKVNPNELFQTAGASAGVGAVLASRGVCLTEHQHGVEADTWTKGRGKTQRQRAARGLRAADEDIAWEELPPAEQAAVERVAKSSLHHVLDAVDMGRWFRTHWRMAKVARRELVLPTPPTKKRRRAQLPLALPPAGATEGQTFGQRLRAQGRLPGLSPAFTGPPRKAGGSRQR